MNLKNWKSSLMGFATGLVAAIMVGLQNGSFELNWKSFLAFLLPTAWGLVQKDFDTTGTGLGAVKGKDVSNV